MIRGENSDPIPELPLDLIIEILSRLSAKSIARCRCVSKLWEFMLGRSYFTEWFLTRSSARPRLLFAVYQTNDDEWCLFSSPQHQNPSSSSLVVAPDIHMKFPRETWPTFRGHVSGLIYFQGKNPILEDDKRIVPVICNPSTGQFALLSSPKWRMKSGEWRSFLGFDPTDKQFKVLSLYDENEQPQILTLGTGNDSWREIHCPLNHRPLGEGICINGVLYYLGDLIDEDERSRVIVCFDVRYEKFKFIDRDFIRDRRDAKLINYKGKLGVITLGYKYDGSRRSIKLSMWVIEDVENQEPEYFSTCWDYDDWNHSVVGVTARGEIVLSNYSPFYVVYVNLERNTRQRVEIQGFENISRRRVSVFVDHVENLKFITMKKTYTATSTYRRRQKFESINKFGSMSLLDDDDDDGCFPS